MRTWRKSALRIVAATVCVMTCGVVAAGPASGQTYTDVGSRHWARSAIDWVTDQGTSGARLLDDYGPLFRPGKAISRAQLARALAIVSGHRGEVVPEVEIPDMTPEKNRCYADAQVALHYGYLGLISKDGERGFYAGQAVAAATVEAAVVRWLADAYPATDWTMLTALKSRRWQPTSGWRPSLPSYFATTIAARQLQLRYNHPAGSDRRELTPKQKISRAEVASLLRRADAASGKLYGIAKYAGLTLPALSVRQRQILGYAFKYVGYPYVWAGEWPTTSSPYGAQAAGGFDCSGFTFYVMQCHFGYPVRGRGAGDQARLAKPRLKRGLLQPGDLIFFGTAGTRSTVAQIYHAGLYMGNGWFIHSTGSSDGVTISSLDDPYNTYWKTAFAWGRRVLKPSELAAG
jgi:cell wall-associated NlpC family hydrolase